MGMYLIIGGGALIAVSVIGLAASAICFHIKKKKMRQEIQDLYN